MLVFVPLIPAALAEWATRGVRDVAGFAATPAFLAAFGLARADDEDADLTLLSIASVDGLLRHGVRLVAVAGVATPTPAEPADFGAVRAAGVPWSAVTSLFADDAPGAATASAVATGLGGADLATAWEHDVVEALVSGTDLLWHGSTEWQRLTH